MNKHRGQLQNQTRQNRRQYRRRSFDATEGYSVLTHQPYRVRFQLDAQPDRRRQTRYLEDRTPLESGSRHRRIRVQDSGSDRRGQDLNRTVSPKLQAGRDAFEERNAMGNKPRRIYSTLFHLVLYYWSDCFYNKRRKASRF